MIIDFKFKIIIALASALLLLIWVARSLSKEVQQLTAERDQLVQAAKASNKADAGYIASADEMCSAQVQRAIKAAKVAPKIAIKEGVKDANGCPVYDCPTISLYDLKN